MHVLYMVEVPIADGRREAGKKEPKPKHSGCEHILYMYHFGTQIRQPKMSASRKNKIFVHKYNIIFFYAFSLQQFCSFNTSSPGKELWILG